MDIAGPLNTGPELELKCNCGVNVCVAPSAGRVEITERVIVADPEGKPPADIVTLP